MVTLTTVGYGDVAPVTPLGQGLAAVIMIMGYGIIAVPTGIVSVELAQASRAVKAELRCPGCGLDAHETDARFCRLCGEVLKRVAPAPAGGAEPAGGGSGRAS